MVRNVALSVALGLAAGLSTPTPAQDLACIIMRPANTLAERRSPLDSVMFTVDGSPVKVCYGRPSARGRTMIGGEAVPYDQIWRTGANEPTMIHTSVTLQIAGVDIAAGSYSLYTVPGRTEWEIVLNASVSQWGHERFYTGEVAEQEIGRGRAAAGRPGEHVETFTISAEAMVDETLLVLSWENTRVEIPIRKR